MDAISNTLKIWAARHGIPPRSLDQVKTALDKAKLTKSDGAMARLMLRHGRLTTAARQHVEAIARAQEE